MTGMRTAIATFTACALLGVSSPAVCQSQDPQDATVVGTQYNATASVPCTHVGSSSPTCPAGVTRSPDQIAVEIDIPGGKRLLLFDGKGIFVTHGSAEADGSASLTSSARREEDWTVVTVGKEQYRIPDAFVLGD